METVEQYLKEMKFKKRMFGGVDEESALLHIKRISELYQDELKEIQGLRDSAAEASGLLKSAQEELEQKKVAYADLQVQAARAERQSREWKEQAEQQRLACETLQAEAEEMRRQSDEWKMRAEHDGEQAAETLKLEYRQKYEELTAAVDTIQMVKKEAAVRAQVEAAQEAAKLRSEILAKTEEERKRAEREVLRLRSEAEALERQKQEIQQEIEMSRKEWQKTLDKLLDELQTVRENMEPAGKAIPKSLSGILGEGRHAG